MSVLSAKTAKPKAGSGPLAWRLWGGGDTEDLQLPLCRTMANLSPGPSSGLMGTPMTAPAASPVAAPVAAPATVLATAPAAAPAAAPLCTSAGPRA